MKDTPIRATATVKEHRGDGKTLLLTLPNGKSTLGHSQLKHATYRKSLKPGDKVTVEMTPFDFNKARIIPTE